MNITDNQPLVVIGDVGAFGLFSLVIGLFSLVIDEDLGGSRSREGVRGG